MRPLIFRICSGPTGGRRGSSSSRNIFRNRLEGDPAFVIKTPANDALSCGITTVEVVGREVREVAQALFDGYRIDCRPMSSHGLNGLRISLSVFNTEDQVDVLVSALQKLAG